MNNGSRSRIPGFHTLAREARLRCLAERVDLDPAEVASLSSAVPLEFETANHMVENAIGVIGLPLGVGLNFRVNDRDYLLPMAIEEPSVIAAASHAARLVREAGGFTADADPPVMIAQIQVVKVPDLPAAVERIAAAKSTLMEVADAVHPNMVRRGGGMRDIEVRVLAETACGPMLVVHLLADVGDAMGANAVNSMAEALGPRIAKLSGGEVRLRILSNLADRRLARASFRIPFELLETRNCTGREVAERVVEAWAFADADPYRAATHNKGIMNGIDAVALATGNDWRGIEAGAHAFAAQSGRYRSLSQYWLEGGSLLGRIELPLAVGIVGGNLEANPRARLAVKMLGVKSARELAGVMAAAGLGQNFAAIRAMVTDGIQRGHMSLHARGLAVAAGAPEALVSKVVERLIACGEIKLSKAREILREVQLGEGVG